MKIARKIMNQNEHDNLTLDRLVNKRGYQQHFPVETIKDDSKEKTTYVFEDGSKLINCNIDNMDWTVKSR